jgi:hypothetical protein
MIRTKVAYCELRGNAASFRSSAFLACINGKAHALAPIAIRSVESTSGTPDVHHARQAQVVLRRGHHRGRRPRSGKRLLPGRDHGITNVCVLEKGYIGGGNTGRNTTIIRSNYLTPEGVKFYDESVQLWQDLSQDFDLNLFYSNRGHFTLAHTDAAMRTMRWRAEVNKHYGVESEVVDAPSKDPAATADDRSVLRRPRAHLGALYHAPGSVARHDAVAWGYGRGADMRGVEIHQQTEVRHRREGRQGHRRADPRGPHRDEQGAVRGRRLHAAHPPTWSASRRRSTSIRCRPWSASR